MRRRQNNERLIGLVDKDGLGDLHPAPRGVLLDETFLEENFDTVCYQSSKIHGYPVPALFATNARQNTMMATKV